MFDVLMHECEKHASEQRQEHQVSRGLTKGKVITSVAFG